MNAPQSVQPPGHARPMNALQLVRPPDRARMGTTRRQWTGRAGGRFVGYAWISRRADAAEPALLDGTGYVSGAGLRTGLEGMIMSDRACVRGPNPSAAAAPSHASMRGPHSRWTSSGTAR
jgi:hypothetical protein